MERIGSQSEFLASCVMLKCWRCSFTHDGGDTSKWRLKGHGKTKFWEWLATWAAFIRNPADLGLMVADTTCRQCDLLSIASK